MKMKYNIFIGFTIAIMLTLIMTFCQWDQKDAVEESSSIDLLSDNWPGMAIAYSGYREGQHPDKDLFPTQEEILEDLLIIEKNWKIIRTYGSDQHAKDILEVIAREKLNIKVMLGIWLFKEPERVDENRVQINNGIEFAKKYKEIIIAINVGNESQVHWSDHKVPNENMVDYIKEVKSKVSVPVSTADTWDYWADLEKSSNIIEVVDFIAAHIYPLWGNVDIDRAMEVTIENYDSLKSVIPNKKIIITEAGWATYTEGDAHVPKAGNEINQKRYFIDLMKWSEDNNIAIFWFEAFDEPWKGTGTEGYWGLFNEKRKAKLAMHEDFPELVTDEPTSPSYE